MAQRKAKSSAKSSHGGRRPGAGRKKVEAKKLRADIVAESERLICDNLPALIGNMLRLANGGYQRVEEKYEPSGDLDADGKPILALVERKVSVADADRAANVYLIDRIMGRPKQPVDTADLLDKAQMFVIPPVDDRPEPDAES